MIKFICTLNLTQRIWILLPAVIGLAPFYYPPCARFIPMPIKFELFCILTFCIGKNGF